jgi:hypothetical protein
MDMDEERSRADNVWDELARRCLVSREFVKNSLMLQFYGGGDPWTNSVIREELERMTFWGRIHPLCWVPRKRTRPPDDN